MAALGCTSAPVQAEHSLRATPAIDTPSGSWPTSRATWRIGSALAGAIALVLLVVLGNGRWLERTAEPAKAHAAPVQQPQATTTAEPELEPANPAQVAAEELQPELQAPEPKEPVVTNAPVMATLPENDPAPREPFPEFHLRGIIYTRSSPKALIDSRTVEVGDRLGEAVVMNIGPTNVTLKWRGELKEYHLN